MPVLEGQDSLASKTLAFDISRMDPLIPFNLFALTVQSSPHKQKASTSPRPIRRNRHASPDPRQKTLDSMFRRVANEKAKAHAADLNSSGSRALFFLDHSCSLMDIFLDEFLVSLLFVIFSFSLQLRILRLHPRLRLMKVATALELVLICKLAELPRKKVTCIRVPLLYSLSELHLLQQYNTAFEEIRCALCYQVISLISLCPPHSVTERWCNGED